MPLTGYMSIKGKTQGDIKGECKQKDKEDLIVCYAMDHVVEIPRDTHTGLPTGQRIHDPLRVTTAIGKHTPQVFQACCSGEHVDVVIDMYRIDEKGQEEKYYTIKLTDAIVVETREWYPETFLAENKPFLHMQDVSFTYAGIAWTYNTDGIEAEDKW